MANSTVVGARIEYKLRIIDYANNLQLQFRPLFEGGRFGPIDDIDSILLYEDKILAAFVVNQPSKYAEPKDIGFWSAGKITQKEISELWDVALGYFKDTPDADRRIFPFISKYGQETKMKLSKVEFKEFEKKVPFVERSNV